jgi:hypothetical protein
MNRFAARAQFLLRGTIANPRRFECEASHMGQNSAGGGRRAAKQSPILLAYGKREPAYYWRGRAKKAKGDIAGSDADIAQARQLDPSLTK